MVKLVGLKQLLKKAQAGHYAVGAFNAANLETIQAILRAAQAEKSPAIVQFSEKSIRYMGAKVCYDLAKSVAEQEQVTVPLCIHLDHGQKMETVRACLSAGFPSIMFDASKEKFADNVRHTKQAAVLARRYGASVEAELGILRGKEDDVASLEAKFTDPLEAKQFVSLVRPDCLATSIGTGHGYRQKIIRLDLERLKAIRKQVSIPLVLHGSSGAVESDIRKAVSLGICKINCDTILRMAYSDALRSQLAKNPDEIDLREYSGPARDAVQSAVQQRMRLCGSSGKA